ncbi:hypothetical protein B0H63DRAFT_470121 [Podospora didyma]|uniref:F-box domain-containing protein n=1 Tax=Podospora didyma TaxID=330526 RepID=A0AAE0NTK6_9PEZI|nr:hypothetical protein B0H63DRAFT_470121 [Podospora didyma]
MAHPPSYQDATRKLDWLEIVAPYAHARDYARLCLVSKRFHRHFAPRLWNDPLTAANTLLLNRDNDLEWYYHFLEHVKDVRAATCALVTCLDLRGLGGRPASAEFSLDFSGPSLTATLRRLPAAFPRLRSILLDGHPDVDAGALVVASPSSVPPTFEPPLLLSIPHCQIKLPTAFFESAYVTGLVYLDVSDMSGSLKAPLTQLVLSSANLPRLRILKAQGREMDDATALLLFQAFGDQLWSLDLSRNNLTDRGLSFMCEWAFSRHSLRSDQTSGERFEVEGALSFCPGDDSEPFRSFCFVKESPWSATYSHPQRYLVDAPVYTRDVQGPTPQGIPCPVRLNGRVKIRDDSASSIQKILSANSMHLIPQLEEHVHDLDICQGHGGITHLYLNENNISAQAVVQMIRSTTGQLEHLDCDSMFLHGPSGSLPKWMPRTAKLSGILGAAHLFRPLFSSNLQVLRIHHSLVTQLPSLETDDLPTIANLWLAETFLLPKAELAYPEAFVPDMNPRLQSLTLTRIPRYSTGRVIEKLIGFLKLASVQERAIQDAQVSTRRGPFLLLGLRRIRLEFEHDPSEELAEFSDSLELGVPINSVTQEFSFFGNSGGWGSSPTTESSTPTITSNNTGSGKNSNKSHRTPPTSVERHTGGGRQPHSSVSELSENGQESGRLVELHHPETDSQSGLDFSVSGWTCGGGRGGGDGKSRRTTAVHEYLSFLRDRDLHTAAGTNRTPPEPASPNHVAAGCPPGSYIFTAAWDAILFSDCQSMRKPTRLELEGMRDVVGAIKAYRLETRRAFDTARRMNGRSGMPLLGEPHFHWSGRLEVSMKDTMAHYHASRYWR